MAASVIGALRVTLGLDSAQFQRGTQHAGRSIAQLREGLVAVSAAMAAVGTAAFLMVRQTAQAANEIARQAQISNTSTDRFQRMAAAARTVGIEQDKLADILKDVNDRVGDFLQTGGGPMADFFENIAPQVGVTAEMFRDLSGADALQLYVDTLERAGLSQAEMTFYLEAMASDATALIPLLADGGAEMERLGDAAALAGGIMSASLIEKSAQFQEASNELTAGLAGIRNEIAEVLMPVFTDLMNFISTTVLPIVSSVVSRVGEWIEAFRDLPGPVQEAVGAVAAVLGVGGPLLVALAAVKVAVMGLIGATGPIGLFILAATAVVTAWQMFGDDIRAAVGGALDWLGEKFDWVVGKVQALIDLATSAKDALAAVFTQGQTATQEQFSFENMRNAPGQPGFPSLMPGVPDWSPLGQAAGEGLATGLENSEAVDAVREYMDSISGAARDELEIRSPSRVFQRIGQWISEGLGLGIRDGQPSVQGAVDEVVGTTTDAISAADSALSQLRSSAQSAFVGLVTGTKSWREALSGVLSSLANIMANQAFNSLFGGMFQGGGFLSGLFGGFRAEGGPVKSGAAYVVGEQGPELFMPRTSGVIVPNDELGGGAAARIEVVGGDLTLTDDGRIMARVRVMAQEARVGAVGDTFRQMQRTKAGWA